MFDRPNEFAAHVLIFTLFAVLAVGNGNAAESSVSPTENQDREAAASPPLPEAGTRISSAPAEVGGDIDAAELFNRRVLPILRSGKGSSCTECHFAGIELHDYIHEDQATTFAALRAEGLIDVDKPDQSKILQFIKRHSADTDPLIAKVREAEFQAFSTWIRAAVREPALLAAKTDERLGSELSDEVIRHMRRDRALASFVETIWSQIGRCLRCHSPEKNQELVQEHGEQVSWIAPNDPAGTLELCVEKGLIDLDNPEESLLLLKPLNLAEHAAGPKFAQGSRTDKNFRRFLRDYAAVRKGKYQKRDELPTPLGDISVLTDQQLRIVGLPDGLDGKLLKVDIYRWTNGQWSESPWGTAENPVAGEQRLWQSMVSALAPAGSQRARELRGLTETRLPGGRYLVKIYIDEQDRAKRDPGYQFSEDDFHAQVETDGRWPPGYQPPKIISVPKH